MPFLAPVVGIAVAGALGLGAVGTAVVQLAIGVGLSLAANKLTGKRSQTAAPGGQQLSLKVEPDADRQVVFGRAAVAGSLVFWQLSGSSNKVLRMVIALADHECQGLHTTMWVDGKERTWNATTGIVSDFDSKLKVTFYNGTAGQLADAGLISASSGRWTSFERGAHVAYAIVEATYDEKAFPGGVPQIVFVVDGAKLYDPRKDTTAGGSGAHRWATPSTYEWTDNPAVIAYNVLRGVRPGGVLLLGMHCPAAAIRFADFVSAANACDELVSLAAGGTEKRYRCNLISGSSATNADVLERILATMAGELVEVGGLYRIMAGVAQASVGTVTDDDIIVDKAFSVDPRRPRSELINAVAGTFSDPSRSYASVPLPLRFSTSDETADGGIRLSVTLDLAGVTSRTQAQRVMEVERRRARRQSRVSCTLRAKWVGLEPGDWITLTSSRRGIVAQTYEIVSASVNDDLTIDVLLQETDAAIDDWDTGLELSDTSVISLGPGGPTVTSLSGFALANVTVNSSTAGVQRPGLRATWTPVDDPSMVQVRIEFRRAGDTVALERIALDPEAGEYTWVDGVQGGTVYEARAIPVARPERAMSYTAWVSTTASSGGQAVSVALSATVAETVPPNTITPELLSAQARFELSLITAVEGLQGSVAEQIARVKSGLQRTNEALAGIGRLATEDGAFVRRQEVIRQSESESFAASITQLNAGLADKASASAVNAVEVRVTSAEGTISSQATSISSLNSSVGTLNSSVSTLQGAVDGVEAFYAVQIQAGGRFAFFRMDGTPTEANAIFGVDKFSIVGTGASPVTPFLVDTVTPGGPYIILNANVLAPQSITANKLDVSQLSAISGTLGSVTTGRLQAPDGKLDIRADAGGTYIRLTS